MRNLQCERFIGDFAEGDVYHHGAVQITPMRNRQYVKKFGDGEVPANSRLSTALGYVDPDAARKERELGIKDSALVSRGFLFNTGFGLSVHDISFNAVANLSYSNLVFGAPVFEGDTVSAESKVLGVEFRKDGATSGSVQVETRVSNQRGETVLSYVRQVLVRAEKGVVHEKSSTVKTQPREIDLSKAVLPLQLNPGAVSANFSGDAGRSFESLGEGEVLEGLFEKGITLADFSWLQIATMNDAAVHHTPSSVFIGYGGAVKALCEGAVSGHFPFAFQLGMNSGAHNAPTYPSDIVREMYAAASASSAGSASGERRSVGGAELNRPGDDHERIRVRAEVLKKSEIPGRGDFGAVTIRLTGEKTVTDGGMKALEAARFGGMDAIFEENGKRFLRVLTLEQVLAVPGERSL